LQGHERKSGGGTQIANEFGDKGGIEKRVVDDIRMGMNGNGMELDEMMVLREMKHASDDELTWER
jgi:hypothetical protein